jgi:hypothetical protein
MCIPLAEAIPTHFIRPPAPLTPLQLRADLRVKTPMNTPRALTFVCPLAFVLACATHAQAKAAYAAKAEMIKRCAAIAVVEVTAVETVEVKGQHWTYSQKSSAKVESVLKGDLPKNAAIAIHGQEDFICAQCRFPPGRYIVFLNLDAGLWVGSNWHLSVRPITTDKQGAQTVDWYAEDKSIATKPQPLADVLSDVKRHIAEKN